MKYDELQPYEQSIALQHVEAAVIDANYGIVLEDLVWDDLLSPQNLRREAREFFEFDENRRPLGGE